MTMLHVFFGHDERVEAGTTAFARSVIARASRPVALVPITRKACANQPEGTNAFTFRRFLVPWMMNFRGWAVFCDGADMVVRADIHELADLADPYMAVQVVKHDYRTRHARKYVGTAMEAENEDYEGKNNASVMLINCSHFAWRQVDEEYVRKWAKVAPMHLLQLQFIDPNRVGALPAAWNHLVDEFGPDENAKLLHWTAGIPAFPAYHEAPMAQEWANQLLAAATCTGGA